MTQGIGRTAVDLGGTWEYRTGDHVAQAGSGDGWASMPIPSNWHLAGLPDYAGTVTFRRRFTVDTPPGRAAILRFHGVDYFADAWLNGTPVGSHEGYFQPFDLDVTDLLRDGENTLVVRVESPREPPDAWPHRKRLIKGVLNHHDCRPGSWDVERGQDGNTGGIWNRVELLLVPEVRIDRIQATPALLPGDRARVEVKVRVASARRTGLTLRLRLVDPDGAAVGEARRDVGVEPGHTEVPLVVSLASPRLWWTWDHGAPDLYRAEVTLLEGGEEVDRLAARFGIRQVRIDEGWNWYLNGRRIFVRGTNVIPAQWLSEYTDDRVAGDMALLRGANVNAVRVHAHVTRDEFYAACDEAGIMVWQDFALQWSYEESDAFAQNATRQIREMVEHLYNHPSIVVWCCHNEPSTNRETLDPLLAAAVRSVDPSRHVDVASDFRFHPYPGWYGGSYREFAGVPAAPFVSEYGAQALPNVESMREMMPAEDLWPPNWERWAYHDFQHHETFHIAGVEIGGSLEEFVRNSQAYQARLIQFATEHYRREKHRRVTGLFHFMFMDCWPSVTWSVVDYRRRPKQGYDALRRAYQPVLPSIRVQEDPRAGQPLGFDVLVVNDLYRPFPGATLRYAVYDGTGAKVLAHEVVLDVAADGVTRLRRGHPNAPTWRVPADVQPGEGRIEVEVRSADGTLLGENAWPFRVRPMPPGAERVYGSII